MVFFHVKTSRSYHTPSHFMTWKLGQALTAIYHFCKYLRFQFYILGEMIDCQDGRDDVDSDSDNEEDDDDDDVDGVMLENDNSDEIKEKDKEGKGFFGRFFEVLVNKLAVFRTRTGRAGLVHNFLRGLQILAAPILSGLCLC